MKTPYLTVVAVASLWISPLLRAENCVANLTELVRAGDVESRELRELLNSKRDRLSPQVLDVLARLDQLPQESLAVRIWGSSDAYRLLLDEENLFYTAQVQNLLTRLSTLEPARLTNEAEARELMRAELRALLSQKVPDSQIESRIDDVLSAPNANTLRRALGQLSFDEIKTHMHGGNPLAPTADSLLGKFISETGASTLVKRFKVKPDSEELGPERLVVAISDLNFAEFKKIFADRIDLVMHNHTPGQGTLYVQHQGHFNKYTQMGYANDFRLGSQENTILPTILLSTSEAQRMKQFFNLGSLSTDLAKNPWQLPGYCATGGYGSCTHWFANVPLGDTLVDRYTFPGFVDQYAYNHLPSINGVPVDPAIDAAPRVQVLGPYADLPGYSEAQMALVRRVWKSPKGNEQLASLLGVLDHASRGEMASPGFTAMTLTGSATVERVPVVFLRVNDHRTPINPNFDPQMNAY
jgi:hypothetical protein